ncbi:MAG: 4Fe-4S ferredoxin [Clostridiaceae bacterium]|nr:4Fe-4S ferredoxin [Eubacteriales bacterium]
MLEKSGVPEPERVFEKFPPIESIESGPVAVIECYEKIPCNPCATACKFEAIEIGPDINTIPVLGHERCTGCAVCLSRCPGLAIMVVDGSKSKEFVEFRIPYEFLPLPREGDIVWGLDRAGRRLSKVRVMRVQNPKAFDRTPVVTLEVPRAELYAFRSIAWED